MSIWWLLAEVVAVALELAMELGAQVAVEPVAIAVQ